MRAFTVLLTTVVLFIVHVQSFKLKQVLILSRHNIRTPLTKNLQDTSTYEFLKWDQKAGELTEKGAKMEGYMGEYFHKWFVQQEFFPEGCPQDEEVHVYANTKQRTKESAKAFVKSAFKNCNIKVVSINSEEMDPIFNPVPLNTSEELKEVIVNEMQKKLNELNLRESYLELNRIVNLKESNICKNKNICDFTEENNEIIYQVGIEPNIKGPLNMGNSIVDSFLMSYYEGMPLEKVAWGQIKTQDQWKLLTQITKENQNIRFNSTVVAKEVARPLLNYIYGILERKEPSKFTLLVGHDSNLNPVIASLGFVTKDLPEQYERTPVGGKLVFQKVEDDSGQEYLKADYVYQSFEQLRNGTKLSLENPPFWFPMQIRNCSDKNSYCPWQSFMNLMRNVA